MAGITSGSTSGFDASKPFDTVLKEFYLGPIRDQLNSSTVLMSRLMKNEADVSGKQVNLPLQTKRNEGVGARSENQTLPTSGNQGYEISQFAVKYLYGRISITGPVIAASRTDKGAFTRALDSEIQGMTRDFKHDINRQLYGDGSGVLGVVTEDHGTATSSTVRQYGDIPNVGANLKFFAPGMNVIEIDSATAIRQANTVSSVDIGAKDVTFGTALIDTSDMFARGEHISNGDDSFLKEMMGLLGICVGSPQTLVSDSGVDTSKHSPEHGTGASQYDILSAVDGSVTSLQGVTDDGIWRPQVVHNSGVAQNLSTDLMQQALDLAEEIGQGDPSIILTSYGCRAAYLDLLVADKRFVNTMELDGGFKALEYNGIPLVADKDCTAGHMYFVDESAMSIYRSSDFFWLDRDGSVLHRLDDKDAYQATMAYYAELGTSRRNSHAALLDIQE